MRNNQPVTHQEFDFPDDVTLMSTTDADSIITYANTTFAQVSGFTNEELVGQPHNAVRHPDMPREAFADMWATLRRGEPWTALVKNRRKNGDHYWVRANAIPVMRNGEPQGYMSVRTKAPHDESAAADAVSRVPRRQGRPAPVPQGAGDPYGAAAHRIAVADDVGARARTRRWRTRAGGRWRGLGMRAGGRRRRSRR